MHQELNRLTMVRLRALARENGLKGYSKKRKAELIDFIRERLFPKNQTLSPSALASPLGPKQGNPYPRLRVESTQGLQGMYGLFDVVKFLLQSEITLINIMTW